MADLQFADFDWQPRWNGNAALATLVQSGAEVEAVGWFGAIRFRLDRDEDVESLVHHVRVFADMIEGVKREYDGVI